ncbi:MAG: acyl-CoA desaturase [Myxococcales bacterium]|nr:acyl-CoA desaturase [Myxococcales bacterium]
MAVLHVAAAIALWLAPPTWPLVVLAIGSYGLRMFGITAGFHRYFAHRAYRTSRVFQFVLAFLGGASTQNGALWWAAHHRDHHRLSDQPGDLHSPVRDGFWWSHIGWIVHSSSTPIRRENIKDFAQYPELWWLDEHRLVAPAIYGGLLFAFGGLDAFLWGYCVSTVALWHGTFVINSLAHVWGSRRYATTDASRNNFWLALVTLGEGWHNNHHHYQSAARQGFHWWEIDGSYLVLRALAAVGIVWKLREVPARVLHANLVAAPAVSETTPEAAASLLEAYEAAPAGLRS